MPYTWTFSLRNTDSWICLFISHHVKFFWDVKTVFSVIFLFPDFLYKFDGQHILSVDFFFQSHANVRQPSSQQWRLRVVLRAGGTLKTDCGLEAFGLKTHYTLCCFLWAVMENEHRSLLATRRSAHNALSRSTTVLKRSSRLCVCVCVSGQLVIRQ